MSEVDQRVEEMEGEEPAAELDSNEESDAQPPPRSRGMGPSTPSEVQT